MNEEILVVIDTNERKALYFTSNRVIVAKVGGQALSMAFGIAGALAESRMQAKKKEQLSKLTPESILTADKKNFAIPYTEITKVELFKKMFGRKIRIIVGGKKHEFSLGKPKELESYVNTLRPVLADKLVVSS